MSENKKIPKNMRIDKWLWAARFFKTRTAAADSVNGGKVHVNGQRVKPSRFVQLGDRLNITRGHIYTVVNIVELSNKRGPSKEAQNLYQETPLSIEEQKTKSQQRKLLNASIPKSKGKPDKHQRREIRKVIGKFF